MHYASFLAFLGQSKLTGVAEQTHRESVRVRKVKLDAGAVVVVHEISIKRNHETRAKGCRHFFFSPSLSFWPAKHTECSECFRYLSRATLSWDPKTNKFSGKTNSNTVSCSQNRHVTLDEEGARAFEIDC